MVPVSVREIVGLAVAALLMVVALAGGPDRLLAYTEGDGGCSGANRLPVPATLEQARTATLCLLNRERAAQGLPALVADARLALAAQLHSDDMGKRHFCASPVVHDLSRARSDLRLSQLSRGGSARNAASA